MARDVLDRLADKFDIDESGCWLWTASIRDGYGQIRDSGSVRGAHRVMFEQLVGEVDEGMDLDHLCRVRRCVNPDHLEPVTRLENILRSPIHVVTIQCGLADEASRRAA